jgi:hypothetical protein
MVEKRITHILSARKNGIVHKGTEFRAENWGRVRILPYFRASGT